MNRSTVCPGAHPKGRLDAPAIAALLGLASTLAQFAGGAAAQPGQETREVVPNRAEVRRDRAELARDVADVRQLENLLTHLDEAHARGDRLAEDRYRGEMRNFLQRKTADVHRDVAQDRRELKRSGRELRGDRREAQQDRRELGQDRRDRRDDARAEVRERRLLGEFLTLTKLDAQGTARELREDRRDLRKDRRERRQEPEERGEGD